MMAIVSLIFKRRVRLGVAASDEFLPFGAIELDASLDETHVAENEVTQFPVEVGADITDHVRRQPDRCTIRGLISNHPLVPGLGVGGGRAAEGYQKLLAMVDEAQLISVVTTLRQYQDMVIESLEVPRDPQFSSSVQCSISLRQVLTAEVATSAGTTDLGRQNATEVAG